MATTFYIDANRQNSTHKSSENNNEWTYKMAQNIQLPVGTEIGIQDTFIHKQGISGATIEIDEDINETLYFSVYLSDNPHFVPKNQFAHDKRTNIEVTSRGAYTPSFLPHAPVQLKALECNKPTGGRAPPSAHPTTKVVFGNEHTIAGMEADFAANLDNYYNMPRFGQRVAMWEDDTEGNPRLFQNSWGIVNDPYTAGFSEYPMMAVFVDEDETYQTVGGDDFDPADAIGRIPPIFDTDLPDPRLKPYVKSVNLFIKKGVYSISEMADLIESQVNGKYVNLQTDDYYTDTVIQKQNEQEYEGTLETEGIYTKAQAFDRYGGISLNSLPDELNDPATNTQTISNRLRQVLSQNAYNAGNAPAAESPFMYPNLNPTGVPVIGSGLNDPYALPYYPDNILTTITTHAVDGTTSQVQVPKYLLAYNRQPAFAASGGPVEKHRGCPFIKGRKPILPTKQHLLYIPVHYYNHLVKMWKYDDVTEGAADQNSYLEHTGNWTVNVRRLFRYGFQTRVNQYGNSIFGGNGEDMGSNSNVIGLHSVRKTNTIADIIAVPSNETQYMVETAATIRVSPANFQYDIFQDGYFVGTPDFSLNYDSDKSAFTMSGLHQSLRVPSCDQIGNPMTSQGQTVSYLRRHSKIQENQFTNPDRTQNRLQHGASQQFQDNFNKEGGADGFKKRVISALNNNADRKGGVAVYNWGYQTCLKYGDIKPETYRRPRIGTDGDFKVYNDRFTYLWTFSEFFSSEEKARDAWETTIWAKLGFSFDNLQNQGSWETCPYYDLPVGVYSNQPSPDVDTSDPTAVYQSIFTPQNTYKENRNNMFFLNEDFKLYGKTTKGDLGIDAIPTVSSVFNNAVYTYTPNPAHTPQPPAGGTLTSIVRTYGNSGIVKPAYSNVTTLVTPTYIDSKINAALAQNVADPSDATKSDGSQERLYTHAFDVGFPFENSMYFSKTMVPILTESKQIIASGLPQLSNQGYYVISSDIVDGYMDDIKQTGQLPLLGIVPISNLSNQDFISTKNDLIHTVQQTKNINSVSIKILNPDLTAPRLLPNSSVVIRITMPLPQQTPMTGEQTDKSKSRPEEDDEQPNPHDKRTQSGIN